MSEGNFSEAVVLMAGSGSRLRASGAVLPKALIPVLGRPLFSFALDALRTVGITTLHVVVGNESATLLAGLEPLVPAEMRLHAINNPDWEKQNGVSLLCAAPHLTAPFLLLMGDHLFEPQLLEAFVRQADPAVLNLAVDRKIDSVFDLDDAMKVETREGQIVAIGKTLTDYDAIDTGVFVCPPEIFSYLRHACRGGDCSLADGVRLMATDGKARVIDIGAAWWQDVDDSGMLGEAESAAAARLTSALRASH
ncbi:MAG: NTP transferase domain-containing protein [Chthoniobacterales bacterium]|nr:NTP transferase domain-containing protein [Chthoniobacterales bacterium]